ncbi:MAG: lysylphosphatidylglycerol synthase transmembrane domain-containing protein [Phycisphaerae bacterium]
MKQMLKKWLWRLMRVAVISAAIAFIVYKVDWHDHAVLADGARKVTVLGQVTRDDVEGVLVTIDDTPEWLPDDRFMRPSTKIEGQRLPVVTPGLKRVVSRIEWPYVLLALLSFAPMYLVLAMRLRLLLRTQGVHIRARDAIKVSYAAAFLNFAVPTGTTGGDIYKAYYVAAHATGRRTEAVTVVLLDRAIGLVNFIFMAAVVCLIGSLIGVVGTLGRMVTMMFIVSIVCGGAFFSQRVRRLLRVDDWLPRLPFGSHLVRIDRTAYSLRQHPRALITAFAWTIFSQLGVCVCMTILARATGMEVAFDLRHIVEYFLAIIVGLTVSSLPGNPPQGFGVLEGIMAYVLVPHFGNWAQIFAVCIGIRLTHLIWSLPGTLVLLFEPKPPSVASFDQAMNAPSPSDSTTRSQHAQEQAPRRSQAEPTEIAPKN